MNARTVGPRVVCPNCGYLIPLRPGTVLVCARCGATIDVGAQCGDIDEQGQSGPDTPVVRRRRPAFDAWLSEADQVLAEMDAHPAATSLPVDIDGFILGWAADLTR